MSDEYRAIARFVIRHALFGCFGGALVGGLLLAADLGGLRGLIAASEVPVLATFLLFFGLFITFGGVAVAIAFMQIGPWRDGSG